MNVKLTRGLAAAAVSAAMMLGTAVPALAVTYGDTITNNQVTMGKDFKNVGSGSESEAFNLKVTSTEDYGYALPEVENAGDLAAGTKNDNYFTIKLPQYDKVGTYDYTLKETAGNTAGVNYDPAEYTMSVIVTNKLDENNQPVVDKDGAILVRTVLFYKGQKKASNKDSEINNSYEAHKLTVTKDVTGALGDTTKDFSFTVTFTNPNSDKVWHNAIKTTAKKGEGDTYTFTLRDGQHMDFDNIPTGITYKVEEARETGYETKQSNPEGTMGSENVQDTVTNNNTVKPPATGVLLNNAPYIAILGGAAVVTIYFVNKRRHSDMD